MVHLVNNITTFTQSHIYVADFSWCWTGTETTQSCKLLSFNWTDSSFGSYTHRQHGVNDIWLLYTQLSYILICLQSSSPTAVLLTRYDNRHLNKSNKWGSQSLNLPLSFEETCKVTERSVSVNTKRFALSKIEQPNVPKQQLWCGVAELYGNAISQSAFRIHDRSPPLSCSQPIRTMRKRLFRQSADRHK